MRPSQPRSLLDLHLSLQASRLVYNDNTIKIVSSRNPLGISKVGDEIFYLQTNGDPIIVREDNLAECAEALNMSENVLETYIKCKHTLSDDVITDLKEYHPLLFLDGLAVGGKISVVFPSRNVYS